jgi:hypothetical protein
MKTILLLSILVFASCKKDKVIVPELPKATVAVHIAVRQLGTTIAHFQTRQTGMELVRAITFFYQGGTVGVPVVSDGRFSIVGHPGTITGYFQIEYKDGRVEKTESKSYL